MHVMEKHSNHAHICVHAHVQFREKKMRGNDGKKRRREAQQKKINDKRCNDIKAQQKSLK